MTDYIKLYVKKRSFKVLVDLPERSDVARTLVNPDDTRVTRNGDTRVTRNGDTRIAHNTNTGYPRRLSVKKRSFKVLVTKVNHG